MSHPVQNFPHGLRPQGTTKKKQSKSKKHYYCFIDPKDRWYQLNRLRFRSKNGL